MIGCLSPRLATFAMASVLAGCSPFEPPPSPAPADASASIADTSASSLATTVPSASARPAAEPFPRCAALDGEQGGTEDRAPRSCGDGAPPEKMVCPSGDKIAWFIDDDAATRATGRGGFRWLLERRPGWAVDVCSGNGPLSGHWPLVVTSIQHAASLGERAYPQAVFGETGGVVLPKLSLDQSQTTPVISVLTRVHRELREGKLDVALVAFDGVSDGDRTGRASPLQALVDAIVALARDDLGVFVVASPESDVYTYVLASAGAVPYVRAILRGLGTLQTSGLSPTPAAARTTALLEIAPGLAGPGATGVSIEALGPEDAPDAVPPVLVPLVDGVEDTHTNMRDYLLRRPPSLEISAQRFLGSRDPTTMRLRIQWSPVPASDIATPFVTRGPTVLSNLRSVVLDSGAARSLAKAEELSSPGADFGIAQVVDSGDACDGRVPPDRGGDGCGTGGAGPPALRAHLVVSPRSIVVRVARGPAGGPLERWAKPLDLQADQEKLLLSHVEEDLGRLPVVALMPSRPELDPCLSALDRTLGEAGWPSGAKCREIKVCAGSSAIQRLARVICLAPPRPFFPGTREDVPRDKRAGGLVLVRVLADLARERPVKDCVISSVRFQVQCPEARRP